MMNRRAAPDHLAMAIKYARDSSKPRANSPPQVAWTCGRFLRWLDDGVYPFDEKAFRRACQFMEKLTQPDESRLKSKTYIIQPWQAFLLAALYGFRDDEGYRLTQEVVLFVPRKAGKSSLAACIALYQLTAAKIRKPDLLFYGGTRDVALHSYNQMRNIIQATPDLQKAYKLKESGRQIVCGANGGRTIALAGTTTAADGHRPTGGLFCDEVHQIVDTEALNVHRTAFAATAEPLLFMTSTAGDEPTSIATQTRDRFHAVMRGEVEDNPHHLGLIYEVDMKADAFAVKSWKRANPSLGVSVSESWYRQRASEARLDEEALQGFLTRQLNVFTAGSTKRWLDVDAWRKSPTPESIEESDCKQYHIGVDAAESFDLASLCVVGSDGKGKPTKVWWRTWVPQKLLDEEKGFGTKVVRELLRRWVSEGRLFTSVGGGIVNLEDIASEILRLQRLLGGRLASITFDQYSGSDKIYQLLPPSTMELCRMLHKNSKNYTPICRFIERELSEGRLHLDKCPVADWAIGNVVVTRKIDGSLLPKKVNQSSPAKIDPIDAMIVAMARLEDQVQTLSFGAERTMTPSKLAGFAPLE